MTNYKQNWIKWLQARIPDLKQSHNEFWLGQALDGYLSDELESQEQNQGQNVLDQSVKPNVEITTSTRSFYITQHSTWLSSELTSSDQNKFIQAQEYVFKGYQQYELRYINIRLSNILEYRSVRF
jgi:hypothetical protein